jgi:uncharacterized membrane protein
MKRLANYFFQGLVYLAPIALTVWVFVATFRALDSLIGFPVPGLGVLVLVVGVTLVGFLLSNFVTKSLLVLLESWLDKLPFARLLHGSAKDFMSAFVGEGKKFKQPVAVEMIPSSGVRAFGFITQPSMGDLGFPDEVGVYFPQAYNFAGQLVMVPKERITILERDSAEIMALIVSGGVSSAHSRVDLPAMR